MATTQVQDRPKSESFRFTLRRATRAEHEALDAHPAFAALMDGSLSLDGYRRLMSLFHGFYAAHDCVLAEACDAHAFDRLGFVYAPRTEILAGDLAALGVDLPGRNPAPGAESAPIHTAATLAGLLYVYEGSMLGGGVLFRAVETLLVRNGAAGDGYWRWCREEGGARWTMTCRAIDALATSETARADMIGGAQAGFLAFSDWFAGWHDDDRSVLALQIEVAARC